MTQRENTPLGMETKACALLRNASILVNHHEINNIHHGLPPVKLYPSLSAAEGDANSRSVNNSYQ